MKPTNSQVHTRTFFERLDLNFAGVILALNLIGLINLYSATHGVVETNDTRLFWQQLFWLACGWAIFLAVTFADYQIWRRIGYILYFFNLGAIIAVEFVGKTIYGSKRWLDLGFFSYQPTETMKLILIFLLAQMLARRKSNGPLTLKELIWPLTITAIPAGLTIAQPDLGTGVLTLGIVGTMLLFVGIQRSILIVVAVLGIITAPLVWNFGLKEYQKNRVITFLSPGHDPRGAGYNSIQSRIAVGSGRILGKGFRKGTQSQLEFIPERHSDFIFSVLSEEHGFIGSITTVGLFLLLIHMSLKIAMQARDRLGTLMVIGISAKLFLHIFINIGMVIGLLPIVGVPLPLLSYGGSSMISTMLGLGIISSVAYRRYWF